MQISCLRQAAGHLLFRLGKECDPSRLFVGGLIANAPGTQPRQQKQPSEADWYERGTGRGSGFFFSPFDSFIIQTWVLVWPGLVLERPTRRAEDQPAKPSHSTDTRGPGRLLSVHFSSQTHCCLTLPDWLSSISQPNAQTPPPVFVHSALWYNNPIQCPPKNHHHHRHRSSSSPNCGSGCSRSMKTSWMSSYSASRT